VNFDNNPGLDERVAQYAANRTKPFKEKVDTVEGMTISRAAGLGLFGELPA
jgi:hypothetical protein